MASCDNKSYNLSMLQEKHSSVELWFFFTRHFNDTWYCLVSHLKHSKAVVIAHLGTRYLYSCDLQQVPSLPSCLWGMPGHSDWEGTGERKKKKKGWPIHVKLQRTFVKSSRVVLGHDRASKSTTLPCSLRNKLLSQADSHTYLNLCGFPQDSSETRKVTCES